MLSFTQMIEAAKIGARADNTDATECTRCGRCCHFWKWFNENEQVLTRCVHLEGSDNNHSCKIYGTGERPQTCRDWTCWDKPPRTWNRLKNPEQDMDSLIEDPGVES